MRILTWHVHDSYLYYLSQVPHEFYLPVIRGRHRTNDEYRGRASAFALPDNVIEIEASQVKSAQFDCVLYQSVKNFQHDQFELLSPDQRKLPKIYIEHDPPLDHPFACKHPVSDDSTLLVHVTPFNALMWDSGTTPTKIIEHGVFLPEGIGYTGEIDRGIVIANGLAQGGRGLGADLFSRIRQEVPLDLVGVGWEELFGLGEVQLRDLPRLQSRYRFFFSPARYRSLSLAVCEAMMMGLPIIGFATSELSNVIQNGVSGHVDTRPEKIVSHMQRLLQSPEEARRLGMGARRTAMERFHIDRFRKDWIDAFDEVTRS